MYINNYDTDRRFDYENGFVLTSEPYRIGNFLSHYELYKMILDIPGDVIELGVFKGSSFIQFCTFRELLENEKSRKIIGFDMFGEFPQVDKLESDMDFVDEWNTKFKDEFISQKELETALNQKKFGNYELIQGNILDTVNDYLLSNLHTRISLLHIDTDVYEPARFALETLYDRVVPGGIIVFDDYATVEGETRAIEEFFHNKSFEIRKFRFSHSKPSYMIKK